MRISQEVDPSQWICEQSEEDLKKWLKDIITLGYVAHFPAVYGRDYNGLDWFRDNMLGRQRVSEPALERIREVAFELLDVSDNRPYPPLGLLQVILLTPNHPDGREKILHLVQSGRLDENPNFRMWSLGYVFKGSPNELSPSFRAEVRQFAISHLDSKDSRQVYFWLAKDDPNNAIVYFDKLLAFCIHDGVLSDQSVNILGSFFMKLAEEWGPDTIAAFTPKFRELIDAMDEPLRQQWKDAFVMGGLPLNGEITYTETADQIAWLESRTEADLHRWIDNLVHHDKWLPLVLDGGGMVSEHTISELIKQSSDGNFKDRLVTVFHQLLPEYQAEKLWLPCCGLVDLMIYLELCSQLDRKQLESLQTAVQPEDNQTPGVAYLKGRLAILIKLA